MEKEFNIVETTEYRPYQQLDDLDLLSLAEMYRQDMLVHNGELPLELRKELERRTIYEVYDDGETIVRGDE